MLHTSCQLPYLYHHFGLWDDKLSGLTLLLGCSLLALSCLFSLAKAICFFCQKLSLDTPPPLFTLSFLHSNALFSFCPSSICHLYFAATIFCALSGLHSITRFSTQISSLFITPSIFFCLSAPLLIYSIQFRHLNNPFSHS